MIAIHCDTESCDTWGRVDTDLPGGFITLTDADTTIGHFCCLDHVGQWAMSNSAPTEVIATDA